MCTCGNCCGTTPNPCVPTPKCLADLLIAADFVTAVTNLIGGSATDFTLGTPTLATNTLTIPFIKDGVAGSVSVDLSGLTPTNDIHIDNGGAYNPSTTVLTLVDTEGDTYPINLGALAMSATTAPNGDIIIKQGTTIITTISQKVVSDDAGNILGIGSDKGALLTKPMLVTPIQEAIDAGDIILPSDGLVDNADGTYTHTAVDSTVETIDTRKNILGEESGSTPIVLRENETLNVKLDTNPAHTKPYTDGATKTLFVPKAREAIDMPLVSGDASYQLFSTTPTVAVGGFDYYDNIRNFDFGVTPTGKWKVVYNIQTVPHLTAPNGYTEFLSRIDGLNMSEEVSVMTEGFTTTSWKTIQIEGRKTVNGGDLLSGSLLERYRVLTGIPLLMSTGTANTNYIEFSCTLYPIA